MLSPDKRKISFRNVRKFAEACNDSPDNFCQTMNVVVHANDTEYLYRNVTVIISYNVGYSDYQVSIMWEEDENQTSYEVLELHGYYSTNFQMFSFSGALSFSDGHNHVDILIT